MLTRVGFLPRATEIIPPVEAIMAARGPPPPTRHHIKMITMMKKYLTLVKSEKMNIMREREKLEADLLL